MVWWPHNEGLLLGWKLAHRDSLDAQLWRQGGHAHRSATNRQGYSLLCVNPSPLSTYTRHGHQAMCKVCDGLRGNAFVAAQEVGFDNLCEIIDRRPCGIDTRTNHMRGTVFPLTEHESKESFRQSTLLDTPDSDGPSNTPQWRTPIRHLLDLNGLTRERVIVQASIDALIIQHPRIHLRARRTRAKGKGADGIKRGDNSKTRWFQEKGQHIGSGKSGASAYYANFTSVEDYGYDNTFELADAYQAHNDPADPGSDVREEALDSDDDEENDTRSSCVALDDVCFRDS